MAGLVQPDGSVLDVFGTGGADEVARRLEVDVLARIPISIPLRESGDAGEPLVLRAPDDPGSIALRHLADAVDARRKPLAGRGIPLSPE